jgi:hypothetical protein
MFHVASWYYYAWLHGITMHGYLELANPTSTVDVELLIYYTNRKRQQISQGFTMNGYYVNFPHVAAGYVAYFYIIIYTLGKSEFCEIFNDYLITWERVKI